MDVNPHNLQQSQNSHNSPHPNSGTFKRNRQADTIDLRSPTYGSTRQDARTDMRLQNLQPKGRYVLFKYK